MAYNQQLSVFSQFSPANTGTAGQVHVSGGNSAPSYWAATIPVSAYSAQFTTNGNYLSVPASTGFQFGTGDFTVECWVYKTSAVNCCVFEARTSATGIPWAFYIDASNFPYFYDGTSYTSSIAVTLNTWTHIAVSRTSGTLKIFVNGVQGYSATNTNSFNGAGTFYIGNQALSGTVQFYGYISNARITKGVGIYTGAFTPPTSPLGTSQAAGTNIAAVTTSQVSLLTCNGPGFTDSSPNAFTVTNIGAVVSSQFAPFSSFSAIARSAIQTQTILTSGSGTYYTPSGVAWLRIRMVGGGGGGGGASAAVNGGSNGTNTVFGSSLLVAGGGNGAPAGSNVMATGGTGSIGSGATGLTIVGGSGTTSVFLNYPTSGSGGNSVFGGGGAGVGPNGFGQGGAGATNSGGGGGGGNLNTSSVAWGAHGGAAGGYVEAYISNPAASYAYTVGAGGGGGAGTGGGTNGGAGGSGVIIIEENYAVNSSSLTTNSIAVTGTISLTSSAFGQIIQCTGTSTDYTVTLPAVSGNAGKSITFAMGSTTALTKLVTISGYGGTETIDGATTRIMWSNETATLYCDGTSWTKIAGKTIPMTAKQVKSTTQTVATGTATKVVFGTNDTFTNSPAAMNDTTNSKIVILRPGKYTVTAQGRWQSATVGSYECLIYTNGGESTAVSRYVLAGDYPATFSLSNYNLAAGAYVESYARQYAGSTQTMIVNENSSLAVVEVITW